MLRADSAPCYCSVFMALRALNSEQIARILAEDGLLIDLRPIDGYLAGHWSGSIPLLYEDGPGLGGRARDLLPLDARLVLLDDGKSPLEDAADSFRGKGFEVVGFARGSGGNRPAPGVVSLSTPDLSIEDAADYLLLDVGDPGIVSESRSRFVPAERLWSQSELGKRSHVGVLAGWGVRAAAAIGILEKLGFTDVAFIRTRPRGAVPPMAGPEVFRVGGAS